MKQLQLLWFPVLLAMLSPASSVSMHDITEMVEVLIKTLPGMIHMAEASSRDKDGPGPALPIKGDSEERELMGHIKQVEHQLHRVYLHSKEAARQAATLVRHLPQKIRLEHQLAELERLLSKIRRVDGQMQEYVINGWDNETNSWIIERLTVEDIALSIVSHREGSVRATLDRLDDLLLGSFHGSPLLVRLARSTPF